MGKNFRSYLLDLRNTSTPFKGVRKALIDTLLDGYETARYGTGVFGLSEYLRYQEALSELATVWVWRGTCQRKLVREYSSPGLFSQLDYFQKHCEQNQVLELFLYGGK